MAKLPSAFTTDGETMSEFSTLPKGKYLMAIVKSELALTNAAKAAGNPDLGQILKFQLKVLAGKYKDRVVFTQLNIINPNVQTVEIANKELTSMGKACGLPVIEDTDDMHGKPMLCDVGIEKDKTGQYPDKNKIMSYASAEGAEVPPDPDGGEVSTAPAATVASAASASKKKMPWD